MTATAKPTASKVCITYFGWSKKFPDLFSSAIFHASLKTICRKNQNFSLQQKVPPLSPIHCAWSTNSFLRKRYLTSIIICFRKRSATLDVFIEVLMAKVSRLHLKMPLNFQSKHITTADLAKWLKLGASWKWGWRPIKTPGESHYR